VTTRVAYRIVVSNEQTEYSSWYNWSTSIFPSLGHCPASYLIQIVTRNAHNSINPYRVVLVCTEYDSNNVNEATISVQNLSPSRIKTMYQYSFSKYKGYFKNLSKRKIGFDDTSYTIFDRFKESRNGE